MVNELADTNTLIFVLENPAAGKLLLEGKLLFVPAPVIGELYYGAWKSARVARNLIRLKGFIAQFSPLNCDDETAEHYGEIKAALRRKGRMIPKNDMWIAAIARQYDLPILTRDHHFNEVEGVAKVGW